MGGEVHMGERDPWEDIGVDERMVSKWVSNEDGGIRLASGTG
jgi:hypothetical protein